MTKKTNITGVIFLTATLLAGCGNVAMLKTDHDFTEGLKAPRPVTEDSSHAMDILLAMPQTKQRNLLCAADLAIWEDERGLTNGGFSPVDLADDLYGRPDELQHGIRRQVTAYGAVPPAVKALGNYQSIKSPTFSAGAHEFFGKSLAWSMNPSSTTIFNWAGVGLAAASVLLSDNGFANKRRQLNTAADIIFNNPQIVYELPENRLKDAEDLKARVQEEKPGCALGTVFAHEIVNLAKPVLQDMGFELVGDPIQDTYDEAGKDEPNPFVVGQEVVNDALGCPRTSDKKKKCRFDVFARPKVIFIDTENPRLIGSFGHIRIDNNSGSVAPGVYLGLGRGGIFISKAERAKFDLVNDKVFTEMSARYPAFKAYLPMRKLDNGTWVPQRVVEGGQTHYFVVEVPRTPDALTVDKIKFY